MHVYLTGFMGVGKTTVGEILARRLERPFVDLDRLIEGTQGLPISEIFRSEGEVGFRALETEALQGLNSAPAVVSLGGGVQTRPENRKWLAAHGTTIWIDLPLDDLVERLRRADVEQRPMWKNEAQIRQLYRDRLDGYSDSDLRIEGSSADSAAAVASRIHDLMEEMQCAT